MVTRPPRRRGSLFCSFVNSSILPIMQLVLSLATRSSDLSRHLVDACLHFSLLSYQPRQQTVLGWQSLNPSPQTGCPPHRRELTNLSFSKQVNAPAVIQSKFFNIFFHNLTLNCQFCKKGDVDLNIKVAGIGLGLPHPLNRVYDSLPERISRLPSQ